MIKEECRASSSLMSQWRLLINKASSHSSFQQVRSQLIVPTFEIPQRVTPHHAWKFRGGKKTKSLKNMRTCRMDSTAKASFLFVRRGVETVPYSLDGSVFPKPGKLLVTPSKV